MVYGMPYEDWKAKYQGEATRQKPPVDKHTSTEEFTMPSNKTSFRPRPAR